MTQREVRRVRHPLKFRLLTVVSVTDLSPVLRRIVVAGDDLEGFVSEGFDDHVKLFPTPRGQTPYLPQVGEDGQPVWGEHRPVARDYTPRSFDAANKALTLEFVIGHGGPATEWAEQVQVGDALGLGGPRGSMVVSTDYATHVLIGDETALPAIGRRLAELPSGVKAVVVAEVEDETYQIDLPSKADVTIHWAYRHGEARGGGQALTRLAVEVARSVDPLDAYVWAATESSVARAMRPQLLAANGFDPKHMKVAGYWRVGDVGAHEVFKDE